MGELLSYSGMEKTLFLREFVFVRYRSELFLYGVLPIRTAHFPTMGATGGFFNLDMK